MDPTDVCSCGHTRHVHNPAYGDECWADQFAPVSCVCSGFTPKAFLSAKETVLIESQCPHCDHPWAKHIRACIICGCLWTDPRLTPAATEEVQRPDIPGSDHFYEGSISAQDLYEAFWAAAKALGDDESVHDMEKPYFDQEMSMIDTSGAGMPSEFWAHMATALVGKEGWTW